MENSLSIKQIRQKNFSNICDNLGRGVVAEKMGYKDTVYINQLCGGHGSFGGRTARKIEKDWEKIERSLLLATQLIVDLGFSERRWLPVKEAVILPVATFISEGGHLNPDIEIAREKILKAGRYSQTRKSIR